MKRTTPKVLKGEYDKLPSFARYDGHVSVKKANIECEYTPEQILEIHKCSRDVNYFAENYCTIVDPDKGKVLVNLRDYQKQMLTHLDAHRFSVVLASRQIGKSTIAAIYIVHYLLFNKDKKIAILANKAAIAKEIFQKVKIAYERLPYWLQIGVVEWHKTGCQLENGSSCFSVATTEDGIRGITANVLFLDEFAFVRRTIAENFFTSVYPTISASKESKIIVVSTPNGLNHFHDIYSKALKGKNDFFPFRVDWWQVPGRDEKWKAETIRNIGQTRFNQEYGNQFLGSSKTLIKPEILESLEITHPDIVEEGGLYRVWERPKNRRVYALGVDTAKGTGGNYSVIQVIDITTVPFKQVAVYRNNMIDTRAFGKVVETIGHSYNHAWVLVENNDIGQATVDYLWHDAEYENLVNYSVSVTTGEARFGGREIGIRSTKRTKSWATDILKMLMEEGKLEVHDQDTIYEMSKFVELKPGIFGAEEGEEDDCVTSLMWGLFIIKTNVLDDTDYITQEVIIKPAMTEEEEEEEGGTYDGMPLPVVDGFGL